LRRGSRVAAFLCLVAAASAAPPSPPIEILVGPHPIAVEIANDPAARAVGLMHRASLPAEQGMLFVFPDDRPVCMWMRNTRLPLSVAFVDASGVILNLADMTPLSEKRHCSAGPVRYALEVNRGWFTGRAISAGERITRLDQVPAGH
jgi:uncharacterized membrane protein (UPF0127 family)